METVDTGLRDSRNDVLMRGHGVASIVLIGLYPFLPGVWRDIDHLVVGVAALVWIVYGRRGVRRDRRRAWTLLAWALVVFLAANLMLLTADERLISVHRFVDAAGNLLVLAAALALIIRRGGSDPGGVIDAAVIAVAAGSLLWAVVPHRLGPDQSVPAQANLFVVVFALTGVLGALLRLTYLGAEPRSPLGWLLAAIALAISGNVVLTVAGSDRALQSAAGMLFTAAFAAIGLFGLDPTAPSLVHRPAVAPERLSTGRLVFLGIAVAAIPIVIGIRERVTGDPAGLLLAVQGTLVAVLVMARIGLLSAQRTRAEQALEHQATHDPLTHLLNRREFVARLRDELGRGAPCVILFCDLDDFKAINDRFGHDTGDVLLVEAARRLGTCIGPSDVVSRFGGDEFVVLLIDATPAQAQATRDCITTALRRPFEPAGGVGIHVSIGLAYTDDERDPERLIRSADRAMYRAKEARHSSPSTRT